MSERVRTAMNKEVSSWKGMNKEVSKGARSWRRIKKKQKIRGE